MAASNQWSASSCRYGGPRWRSSCPAVRAGPRSAEGQPQRRLTTCSCEGCPVCPCPQLCTRRDDLSLSLLLCPSSGWSKHTVMGTSVYRHTVSAAPPSWFRAGSGAPAAPCPRGAEARAPVSQAPGRWSKRWPTWLRATLGLDAGCQASTVWMARALWGPCCLHRITGGAKPVSSPVRRGFQGPATRCRGRWIDEHDRSCF